MSEKKLWGGRFEKAADRSMDDFHSSIAVDQRMYREDIRGSIAHARMLTEDLPERVAMLQMRKHIAWYMHGYRDAAMLRARINETVALRPLEEELCRFAGQILMIDREQLLSAAEKVQKCVMHQGKLDI